MQDRYASDEIIEDAEMNSMVGEKKLIAKEAQDTKAKHRTFDRIKQLNAMIKEKISHRFSQIPARRTVWRERQAYQLRLVKFVGKY